MTQTVLITGASAGIGAALAEQFAKHGHNLILVARNQNKLEAVATHISNEYSVDVHLIPCDLAEPHAAEDLFATTQEMDIPVDILVNNAGILFEGPFAAIDLDKHRSLIQLNLMVLTELCHLYLPAMIANGGGKILNVASTSAFQPIPNLACYAASKAYVLSLSQSLSIENEKKGITVTALCPGFTNTDMTAKEDGAMSLPFLRNMEPKDVARQGYKACMAGAPVYVNGVGNKLTVEMTKYQPRWLQRKILGALSKDGF